MASRQVQHFDSNSTDEESNRYPSNPKLMNQVIQIYHASEERERRLGGFNGFGDYLRGCFYLEQFCRGKHELLSCYSGHKVHEFLESDVELPINEVEGLQFVLISDQMPEMVEGSGPLRLFSNKFPTQGVDHPGVKYVSEHFLRQRSNFKSEFRSLMTNLGLVDSNYYVLHARLGDKSLDNTPEARLGSFIECLSRSGLLSRMPKTVLISDNIDFLDLPELTGLIRTGLKVEHIGLSTVTREGALNSLLEFFLMVHAQCIFQYSIYPWGSSFSQYASLFGSNRLIKLL